ncbi:hypothetical protein [Actinoplanes sp. NPDC049681]|uniref:hypothetical protein n=1 Tax=Actinoplanes sp. NPDC049681 TaxID=3363905 RepID=UPI0037B156DC
MAVYQLMLLALAVLSTSVIVYGLWQMARGRRAQRRGQSGVLLADGAARILSGAFGWMIISMMTGAAYRLGDAGALAALIFGLTLLGLSGFIRLRWGQRGASSEGS